MMPMLLREACRLIMAIVGVQCRRPNIHVGLLYDATNGVAIGHQKLIGLTMPNIRIVLEADGAFPELLNAKRVDINAVGMLHAGMTSGKSSIVFVLTDADGNHYFGETSLALFMGIAAAFRQRAEEEESI